MPVQICIANVLLTLHSSCVAQHIFVRDYRSQFAKMAFRYYGASCMYFLSHAGSMRALLTPSL